MPDPVLTPPTPQWINGGELYETPASNKFALSYGYKWTQIIEGAYDLIIDNGNDGLYNRGVVSGNYIVNDADITRDKGGKGRVEIHWQSIDGYVNPDEWSLTPEDLQPRIERHPLFASLLPSDLATVQQALLALNNGSMVTALNQFNGTNGALMTKLYEKMRKGSENYYLAGWRYTWASYYLPTDVPTVNIGGVTQTPGGPPAHLFPFEISWLRLADDLSQAAWCPLGGIVKLTRHWIGGPMGFWDPDIYPPG
ncbi:MAG TPA: hypothetical protein VH595_06000 [Verrucomicrobiae bacterium]|jgi:hypothetical protein|nr:hypothetical protein [Verrucomicrobiae bacterium]